MGRIQLSLAVLIIAGESSDEARGQAALLNVAGQALLEYQIRLARSCGGRHFVVLVDQLPAAMIALFDRLRADGIDVDVARDARDAADRIHPEEQVLLLSAGLLPRVGLLERICARSEPVLVTIGDDQASQGFERIDAQDRWAGLALLNGRAVRDTAAMLGDWSMGSTLLRQSLQAGIGRFRLERSDDVTLVDTDVAAVAHSHKLIGEAAGMLTDAPGRSFFLPAISRLVEWLLPRAVPVELIAVVPPILAGSAMLLGLIGWHATAFLVLLIACLTAAVSKLAHKVSIRENRLTRLWYWAKTGGFTLLVLLGGWSAARAGQDSAALLLALWALSLYLWPASATSRPRWAMSVESGSVVMFLTTALQWPVAGVAALVIHGLAEKIINHKTST